LHPPNPRTHLQRFADGRKKRVYSREKVELRYYKLHSLEKAEKTRKRTRSELEPDGAGYGHPNPATTAQGRIIQRLNKV
jgi:hypothetical protein